MCSWGEHTHQVTSQNGIKSGPPGDHVSPTNDHMIHTTNLSAVVDIELDIERGSVLEDSKSSTPSIDKLPLAKALQVFPVLREGEGI